MSYRNYRHNSLSPQEQAECPEQREERLGIAASELRTNVDGISEQEARDNALDVVRTRYRNKLFEAFDADQPVLLEGSVVLDKSYAAIDAAWYKDEPITILCGCGHEAQYGQCQEWCEKYELDWKTVPRFYDDCETARGDHGESAKRKVRNWHDRGATPIKIHQQANPRCTTNGTCEYQNKMDFDPDEYEVLIGDHTHAYADAYTDSRVVILDGFPGESYVKTYDPPQTGISEFLKKTRLDFKSFKHLLSERDDPVKSRDAKNKLETDYDIRGSYASAVIGSQSREWCAKTPFLVYALLDMTDLENGWECTSIGNYHVAHNKTHSRLHLLESPNLNNAKQVIGLDGTPSRVQWNIALGYYREAEDRWLDHRQVPSDSTCQKFVQNVLNLDIVKTTKNIYPYSSGEYVDVERDIDYLKSIREKHNTRPTVVTSGKAKKKYTNSYISEQVKEVEQFEEVIESNTYSNSSVSVVLGSTHYGDPYIKKWSALGGTKTVRQGKGKYLTYTQHGGEILEHMREKVIAQAIMGVRQSGNGAIVYVHTGAIPDWIPIEHRPDFFEVDEWTAKQKDIIKAISDIGDGTTTNIAEHPAVDSSSRYVRQVLNDLTAKGYVQRLDTGSKYRWSDIKTDEIG